MRASINSNKYFCELAPEYHIAAAGSLLGVAIHRERYSFPVGKVESNTPYPLDFEEFLWAVGEERLAKEIIHCFNENESMPAQLAKENKKFQYKVVQKGGSASMFGESIEWLSQAGVVLKCPKIEQAVLPISVYADLSSFKLYLSDVGLLVMKSGAPQQTILIGEPNIFMGSVTENFVAQALLYNGHSLHYWASEHTAKIDFVLQNETDIIGTEVKKGIKVRSKSLGIFIEKYNPSYCIRLSEKNFGYENNVKSIPLYVVLCI